MAVESETYWRDLIADIVVVENERGETKYVVVESRDGIVLCGCWE